MIASENEDKTTPSEESRETENSGEKSTVIPEARDVSASAKTGSLAQKRGPDMLPGERGNRPEEPQAPVGKTSKRAAGRSAPSSARIAEGDSSQYEIDGDALLASYDMDVAGADILDESRPQERRAGQTGRLQQERPRRQEPENEGGQVPDSTDQAEIAQKAFQRIIELEGENRQLRSKVSRLQQDVEKIRSRYEREKDSIRESLNKDFMGQLLPLVDNFDRAIGHAMTGAITDDFVMGVLLIYKQLSRFLEQNDVIPIMALGESFNPELHEAVIVETGVDQEDDIVIAELEKGYQIRDKLLRPARVKVSVRVR
ncbi:MAG: nucleotide exchange factor GrpE [Blastocatellia bacterium]